MYQLHPIIMIFPKIFPSQPIRIKAFHLLKTMKVTPNVFCFSSVVNAVGKDGVKLFMTLRLRLIKIAQRGSKTERMNLLEAPNPSDFIAQSICPQSIIFSVPSRLVGKELG